MNQEMQSTHVSVRAALAAHDLVTAARLEADAAGLDGYDVTAELLRKLADEIERLQRGA